MEAGAGAHYWDGEMAELGIGQKAKRTTRRQAEPGGKTIALHSPKTRLRSHRFAENAKASGYDGAGLSPLLGQVALPIPVVDLCTATKSHAKEPRLAK